MGVKPKVTCLSPRNCCACGVAQSVHARQRRHTVETHIPVRAQLCFVRTSSTVLLYMNMPTGAKHVLAAEVQWVRCKASEQSVSRNPCMCSSGACARRCPRLRYCPAGPSSFLDNMCNRCTHISRPAMQPSRSGRGSQPGRGCWKYVNRREIVFKNTGRSADEVPCEDP